MQYSGHLWKKSEEEREAGNFLKALESRSKKYAHSFQYVTKCANALEDWRRRA
jgi:hypothetical protein